MWTGFPFPNSSCHFPRSASGSRTHSAPQFSIRWLVTKDGGAAGGFEEKVRAAEKNGVQMVVIRRPKEDGESYETILEMCKEMMG